MLIFFGLIVIAIVAYMWFLRPTLAQKHPELFSKIDEIEAILIDRSRTILASRLYWVGGALLAFHDGLGTIGFDWQPYVNQIAALIPEQWRGLAIAVAMVGTGLLFEWLRKKTTQPLANKE